MNYTVLHKSSRRIRISMPIIHMTFKQADILEYYLASIPGIKNVSVDERTGNATILFSGSKTDNEEVLRKALSSYNESSPETLALVPENTGRSLNRDYEQRLIFKILTHYLIKIFFPDSIRMVLTILKSTPFIIKTLKTLSGGRLKVEALDGIAIASSILREDYSTAGSIMFLLDTGETLEEWTRKKSIGDLARSMSLNVDYVWAIKDGTERQIPIDAVDTGDLIVVRTSDIIPLDGKVHTGEMTVDQSAMTGESEPVMKCAGKYVYAGTVVEEGQCVIEVTKKSGSGMYDRIVQMITESEKLKSETETKAYRLADSLVPYSFAGFGITFALTQNLTKALSFLMVDYSCAMKLSMPLAVLSAIKESAEYGISIKGGKFMELISEADTIVFDKTGTLTEASPKLVETVTFAGNNANEMIRIAACLEEHYPHSIANAIVNGALEKGLRHDELHSKVEYVVAHGVSSYIGDKKAVIGSYHFVMEDEGCVIPTGEEHKLENIDDKYSKIYLAIDGVLSAVLCILDPVRKEAGEVINQLHDLGFTNVCMITGDNEKTAKYAASILGIDSFLAGVLPEDKAGFIKKLKNEGHKVIMVGDGINDSPSLSEADVGIAMDSGAAITREIADITIASDDLNSLLSLRKISVALMQRIKSNYRFIIGFNSSLIALGLSGVASPSLLALMHNGSTVLTGVKSTGKLITED